MDISTSLLAKGAAGALATTAAISGGVVANKNGLFDAFFGANAEENENLQADPKITVDVEQKAPESPKTENEGLPDGTESLGDGHSPSAGKPDTNTVVQGNESEPRNDGDTGGQTTVSGGVDLSEGGRSSNDQVDHVADTAVTVDGEGSPAEKPENEPDETEHKQSQDSNGSGSKTKQKPNTTKWDNALINYLKDKSKSNRDITFTVKTGKDGNGALTDSFPNFEDEGGKGKSGNKQKSIVTVTVTTSNDQLKGDDRDTKIAELKAMNGDKDWTWECKVIFSKEKGDDDNLDFEGKEKLVGNEGFFNKLAASNNKELKIKFIKNCAESRDDSKSTEYNGKTSLGDNEKITSEKTFKLEKEDDTKLKIKGGGFDVWFSEPTKTKQLSTGS